MKLKPKEPENVRKYNGSEMRNGQLEKGKRERRRVQRGIAVGIGNGRNNNM
jgi:hypothetical protein